MGQRGIAMTCIVKNDMSEQVKQIADERNLKKSQVMRQALYEYLEGSANRPVEAALLVQLSNQIEAIKNLLGIQQYQELTKTLESIVKLK